MLLFPRALPRWKVSFVEDGDQSIWSHVGLVIIGATRTDVDAKGCKRRPVELNEPGAREATDKVRERRFRQAHQLVTVDPALVAQPLVLSHGHLRGKSMPRRVDRRAHDGRELRVDSRRRTRATASGPWPKVSPRGRNRHASHVGLVAEDVFRFGIQLVDVRVDDRQVS